MAPNDTITPPDAATAAFMQSIALAVADAYDKATPFFSDTTRPIATSFAAHHRDHAAALAKQAGTAAATVPNQALTLVLTARLQNVADERAALSFAFDVENQVSATSEFTLTKLTSTDVIHLVATIITIVAGHAAILASSAGITTTSVFPNGATETTSVGDGSNLEFGFDPTSFPPG